MDGDTSTVSEETEQAIMEAVYAGLCRHGYASLTIDKIGKEFEKSKSLLYYHFEDKKELLLEFLRYVLDRFEEEIDIDISENPIRDLREFFDVLLPREPEEEERQFRLAILELRLQAPYEDRYQREFERLDASIAGLLSSILENGVERGIFRPMDTDGIASFLTAIVNGVLLQEATTPGAIDIGSIRTSLDVYVDRVLVGDRTA